MDDLGSGSSSLSMLHTMDVLKSDLSFLAGDEKGERVLIAD